MATAATDIWSSAESSMNAEERASRGDGSDTIAKLLEREWTVHAPQVTTPQPGR